MRPDPRGKEEGSGTVAAATFGSRLVLDIAESGATAV